MKNNLLPLILLTVVLVPAPAEAAWRRAAGAAARGFVIGAVVTTSALFGGRVVHSVEPGPEDVDRGYDCNNGRLAGPYWVCKRPMLVIDQASSDLLAELARLQPERVIIMSRIISEAEWLGLRKLVGERKLTIYLKDCFIEHEACAEPVDAYLVASIPDGLVVA